MKTEQEMSRETLAAHFEALARAIREGATVAAGGETAALPESVFVETELEADEEGTEFEVEVRWSTQHLSKKSLVAILTGSPSDLSAVEMTGGQLEALGIPHEVRVLSAHRTPDWTVKYVKDCEKRGVEVFIACAGLAAHLAGVVASHTLRPVIGVPLASGPLSGLDSLLSTVQMPPGVPVATVAVDGVKNAAFLAARILSGKHPDVLKALEAAAEEGREKYEKQE